MPQGYLTTLADVAQIPQMFKDGFLNGKSEPRLAFCGRSNVGKSSLINALMEERIARVSGTPGKTRAINFFEWPKAGKIVADLPGYGFALRAKKEKNAWIQLLDQYFEADDNLAAVLILFDSRHGPTDIDIEALEYFLNKEVPIQIMMTKFDQLKTQSERHRRKQEVLKVLSSYEIPDESITWVSTFDQKSIHHARKLFI